MEDKFACVEGGFVESTKSGRRVALLSSWSSSQFNKVFVKPYSVINFGHEVVRVIEAGRRCPNAKFVETQILCTI